MQVLVVDDQEVVRLVVREVLTSAGHDAATVATAEDALAHIEASPDVDLLITDLKLPRMSGFELVEAVRAAHPKTAVIVLTGGVQNEVQQRLRALGAPVVQKPFEADVLLEAVAVAGGLPGSDPPET